MSKKQIKRIIFMGLGCAVLLIAAVIYSLLYNEGRWVKEMDMSTYVFSPKDIPMLAAGVLIAVYAVYILVLCVRNALLKKYPDKKGSKKDEPEYIKTFRRLRDYKEDHLRFMKEFIVPYTNNRAEQKCRVVKGKKNVSGQFVTKDGADAYAGITSIIQTSLQNKESALDRLAEILVN